MFMDDDGYPTDKMFNVIEDWDHTAGFQELMEFIKPYWKYADAGYWIENPTKHGIEYSISTAGWSGNEDIVDALRHNMMFWTLCWVQSRRGGDYIFEVPNE